MSLKAKVLSSPSRRREALLSGGAVRKTSLGGPAALPPIAAGNTGKAMGERTRLRPVRAQRLRPPQPGGAQPPRRGGPNLHGPPVRRSPALRRPSALRGVVWRELGPAGPSGVEGRFGRWLKRLAGMRPPVGFRPCFCPSQLRKPNNFLALATPSVSVRLRLVTAQGRLAGPFRQQAVFSIHLF